MDTKINNAGLICSREPRFKDTLNINPGPAAYTVSECTIYHPIFTPITPPYS